MNWTDNVRLSGYIFSTNNSGKWQNDSFKFFEFNDSSDIFADSFESGDFSAWTGTYTDGSSTITVDPTEKYHGINSTRVILVAQSDYAFANKTFSQIYNTLYAHECVKFIEFPHANGRMINTLYVGQTDTILMEVGVVNDSGTIKWQIGYWHNTGRYESILSSPLPSLNTWYCIEAKVVRDGTNGEYRLYIDGTEEWSVTGINNDGFGTGNSQIRIGGGGELGGTTWAGIGEVYIDDVIVDDEYVGVSNSAWSNVTKLLNATNGAVVRWRVYANDTSNNWNASQIFSLTTTDVTPPLLTVLSPVNTTYGTSWFWANVSLNEAGSAAWYSLDGLANQSLTQLNSTYFYANVTSAQGSHYIAFYANDTSGNENASATIHFTLNITSFTTLALSATTAWWNDSVTATGKAQSTDGSVIPDATVNLTVADRSCSNTTDANGEWICAFNAPLELGDHTVAVTITKGGTVITNSTTLTVKLIYGTEPVGATERIVHKVPVMIQEPTGRIRKVWISVMVW